MRKFIQSLLEKFIHNYDKDILQIHANDGQLLIINFHLLYFKFYKYFFCVNSVIVQSIYYNSAFHRSSFFLSILFCGHHKSYECQSSHNLQKIMRL